MAAHSPEHPAALSELQMPDWEFERFIKIRTRLVSDLKRHFGADWRDAFAFLLGMLLGDGFRSNDRDRFMAVLNDALYGRTENGNVIPQVVGVRKAHFAEFQADGTKPSIDRHH
jgi:hypothetical protein